VMEPLASTLYEFGDHAVIAQWFHQLEINIADSAHSVAHLIALNCHDLSSLGAQQFDEDPGSLLQVSDRHAYLSYLLDVLPTPEYARTPPAPGTRF